MDGNRGLCGCRYFKLNSSAKTKAEEASLSESSIHIPNEILFPPKWMYEGEDENKAEEKKSEIDEIIKFKEAYEKPPKRNPHEEIHRAVNGISPDADRGYYYYD